MATPTDQLAAPGLFAASEVTPEGGIYTGYGEVAFQFGDPLVPYVQPERSLPEGGRYPIIRSSLDRGGVSYVVTLLATPVDGVAVDVVRVTMRNLAPTVRRAAWAVGVRHTGEGRLTFRGSPFFRYLAPAGTSDGLYAQPGEAWRPARRWDVVGDAIVSHQAGRASAFAVLPAGRRGRTVTFASACDRRTEICALVRYTRVLRPGATARLVFKVPAVPIASPSAALADAARLGYPGAHAAVRTAFDAALGRATRLRLPERAVADAYDAGLVQMLTSRYRLPDGRWVQTVNDLQYHAFWLRDTAVMTNALDLAGLPGPAAEDLAYLPRWQRPDGLLISRPGQYDGMGEALWALGRHAELTGDVGFARAQLSLAGRAATWLERQFAREGLMPSGDPADNEFVAGRLAGDNFWAVAGIDAAVRLARVARRADLLARWEPIAARVRADVTRATRAAAAGAGGAVPPALDRPGGRDWGNWWAAYPGGPLDPGDPIVGATIRRARADFREGIATYAGGLHDYSGFRLFETELERGEQAAVVAGLYGELAHSTGTLGGFETDIRPGGDRSTASNLTPHGTYSGELVTLIRNMLVRGDPIRIVLLGAVPGRWLAPGEVISVRPAPTPRGQVSFVLRSRAGGATLSWSAPAGTLVVWPVPYAATAFRASAGRVEHGVLRLPRPTGSLRVRWTLHTGPTLAGTVARLRRRYSP